MREDRTGKMLTKELPNSYNTNQRKDARNENISRYSWWFYYGINQCGG